MGGQNKIAKDPRIIGPFAELLKKIQEILGRSQTESTPSPEAQDTPSSKSPHPKR